MQQYFALVYLLVALAGHTMAAPLEGSSGDCPGGFANGAILERGRFFYECRDGNVIPKGCVSDELKRLNIGSTVDKKYYRIQCALGNDGYLTLDPVACLFQGVEHKIAEEWEDGNNYYTCKKVENNELRASVVGCVDQGGRRIALNDKITKEDFVYVCNQTVNSGARLMPNACVKDGREYQEGEAVEASKFWYTCTRVGREKLALKPSGCVSNGKRLNDGDRFTDQNDVIYECTVDGAKNDYRVAACSQRDENGNNIERKLGCGWIEGIAPIQYEWMCMHDPVTNTAKKVQVRCNYNVGAGVYNIDPGCYRMDDKTALGCLNSGSSGLKLETYSGEQAAQNAGLRSC